MKKVVKVVLAENVADLGLAGEEKKVVRGYVKNYLLPKKLVYLADDPQAKQIISKIKVQREKLEKEIVAIKKLAEKISQEKITISAKAGETGKLFGSVTSEDIAKKLKLDKKLVKIEPIRSAGTHKIAVDLGYGVKAQVEVNVEAQQTKKTSKSKKK